MGLQIRALVKDRQFENRMTPIEKDAQNACKEVIENFLGNNKHPDYVKIVNNMLQGFRVLGCNMNLKSHFLSSHLDAFPKIWGQSVRNKETDSIDVFEK